MINRSLPTKQSINKAVKRKLGGQTVHDTKLIEGNIEKTKKVPLKAELIVKLNNLEKEHEALKVEHEALKVDYTKYIEINNSLERKIEDLEKNSQKIEPKKIEAGHEDTEDLDLSFGPRYCNICGFETEDGYQLDGHLWSEHEDEDDLKLFVCQYCDQSFSNLKNLMTHKKSNHLENVSICSHFSNGACPYDETCWFQHVKDPKETSTELCIVCNICKKNFKSISDLMIHRKNEHEENIKMCRHFKQGNCTCNIKCWFSHRKEENFTKEMKKN